jgi:Cu+-exporting ATPase
MTLQANESPRAAKTQLAVGGMTCQGCARRVTEAIQSVPGVAHTEVQLDPGAATVGWAAAATPDVEAVVQAIAAAGYHAKVVEWGGGHQRAPGWSPLAGWRFNVVVGGSVTLLLMVGEWALGLGAARWFQWLSFALALPVQVLCGARFYGGAWRQLKAGSANMDTLVALGSTTAFVYSALGLAGGWHVHPYFTEAAAIITLISLGHWLEAKASERAASSLRALLNLAPPVARCLDADGIETETPVASLRLGDRVALKPGDHVPTDGEVVAGQSTVDEAMLTGESLPVEKAAGAALYAGTMNLNGRLVMRVTATGEATALAHIIAVVRRAQTSRASIQKLGDRVSSVFVPVVVLVALGTALWWGLAYDQASSVCQALTPWLWPVSVPATALAAAIMHACAVLIVACPCAMGLATPAAIMAGANAAARRGILIRDGLALEKSGRITAVVFDKTGTLTQGQVTVADRQEFREPDSRTPALEWLAAALAAPSSHPLSQAIAARVRGSRAPAGDLDKAESPLRQDLEGPSHESGRAELPLGPNIGAAQQRRPTGFMAAVRAKTGVRTFSGPAPDSTPAGARPLVEPPNGLPTLAQWEEVRGCGVQAQVAGGQPAGLAPATVVRLGSLKWLCEVGVDMNPAAQFVRDWSAQGATVLGLAADQRLLGAFALSDALKPRAAEVVARLRRQGKRTYLVTGDNAATATAIATQAGIPAENVLADVRPGQKAEVVKTLQRRGERVAFVGDGINDAPALEQADLGIAVSRASDVAREAADIILLRSDIDAIPEALALAQATLRTIKQNLFWAFFYNAAAVPLAALGFISPIVCAAAMGLSDLLVIGNALRLTRRARRSLLSG